ncbi:ABC transporter permease [Streptomyces pseudovenezuelae]|uniref:Oligopeptide transport system permease protein OppC n=1 Tax=Streptomyces pseudovenezuelae TaxID=67350 RepID=A0ABT6LKR1_9ACTN|nr:ABC transporter permease [Streptomyces pseudovenezuelae]MDH6216902.1 peptide/nickel transport system permease protein [Streptomyces pseudovenezuelae]
MSYPRRGRTLRRLVRSPSAVTGTALLCALLVLAFAGPALAGWSYTAVDYTALRVPPGSEHWFGTNRIGQDVFAQCLRGLQKSLLIGFLVAVVSTAGGTVVGVCAGYLGGWPDRLLMFLVDLMLVVPAFLVLVVAAPRLREVGWIGYGGLLAAFGWMITARAVRAMTRSLKERQFVVAARYMGLGPIAVVRRHILPHLVSFLTTDATVAVAGAVISETGLSYVGFGVQPPDVSLGTLIADSSDVPTTYPWMFYFPVGLLVLLVLACHLVGEGLRDAFDPVGAAGAAGAVPVENGPAVGRV